MSAPDAIALPDLHRLTRLGEAPDLASFAESAARTIEEAYGARAVVVSYRDPRQPAGRHDVVVAGGRVGRATAAAPEGTPGRVLRKGARLQLKAGKSDNALAEAAELLGSRPSSLVGWPLGPRGDEHLGTLLVCDPPAGCPIDLLEAVAVPIVGSLLARQWDGEGAAAANEHLATLFALSRQLIGSHARIAELRDMVLAFGQAPGPVLLLGERGAGKRHLASVLHAHSPLADRLFTALECSRYPVEAIQAGLFEDWFGHGPLLDQEIVLYLHDAVDLPAAVQRRLAKILAPVFEGSGPGPTALVLLGSSKDIRTAMSAGKADGELFGLFNQRAVPIPPLRERPEDIPALIDHFLAAASERLGRRVQGVTHEAVRHLRTQLWPDNLDDLERLAHRAVRLASDRFLDGDLVGRLLPGRRTGVDGGADLLDDLTLLQYLKGNRQKNWRAAIEQLKVHYLPAATPILLEKLQAEEPIIRIETIDLLVRHGDPATRGIVVEFLKVEENRDVISAALVAFTESISAEAAPACLGALDHGDPSVRSTAVRAVGRLGGEQAARAIQKHKDDPDPHVRATALAALYRLGKPEFQRELVAMLKDDQEAVRVEAASALGEVPESISNLLNALGSDPSIDVRIAAVTSLGRIGDPQAVRPLVGRLADPLLKLSCIEALGHLAASEALPPLLDLVARESSSLMRRTAIQSLARIGDPSIVDHIRPYIQISTLGPAVVGALSKVGGPAAEETLIGLLSPDDPLCGQAIAGLTDIGTERSIEPLLELLARAPEYLAPAISRALAGRGAAAVGPLVDALDQPNLRRWAIRALGRIGDPRAVGPMMRCYDVEGPEVALAIETIGPAAIDPLVDLLPARQDEVLDFLIEFGETSVERVLPLLDRRETAAVAEEVLVHFREASVGPLLEKVESVDDTDVLARILRILGRTGAREAFPILLKHFVRPDPTLKGAVIEGLGEVDNPILTEGLVDIVDGDDPRQAILALGSLARIRAAEAFDRVLEAEGHPVACVRHAALLAAVGYGGEARSRALEVALGDTDPIVLDTVSREMEADGRLPVEGFASLLEATPALAGQVAWVRLLGRLRTPAAARALLSVLQSGAAKEVRGTALKALQGWDTRLLPVLWTLLESVDPKRREIGKRILGNLSIDADALAGRVADYGQASPGRRASIESHLAANADDATALLHEVLSTTERTEDRFAILSLLEAIQSAGSTR